MKIACRPLSHENVMELLLKGTSCHVDEVYIGFRVEVLVSRGDPNNDPHILPSIL